MTYAIELKHDVEMTVVSTEFAKLGYYTEATLCIEPQRGRYIGIFWFGEEEREVAWEPSEPDRQELGVQWAFRHPEDAVLDLMKIDISRREESRRDFGQVRF